MTRYRSIKQRSYVSGKGCLYTRLCEVQNYKLNTPKTPKIMISTDNASVVINNEYFVKSAAVNVMVLDEMTSTRIITRIVTLCSRFFNLVS